MNNSETVKRIRDKASLINYLYNYFMKEAYKKGIVVTNVSVKPSAFRECFICGIL